MKQGTQDRSGSTAVRKVITVDAPPPVAWRVFTEQMTAWWPLKTHKIGKAPAIEVVMEPRAGGRWYERDDDGTTCDWGRVLVWQPNSRLVLSWEISAEWHADPGLETQVEVRFTPEGEDATRVDLEHRQLDRYGAKREQMREIFDGPGGWGGLLASFAVVVATKRVE